eukprot:141862_1
MRAPLKVQSFVWREIDHKNHSSDVVPNGYARSQNRQSSRPRARRNLKSMASVSGTRLASVSERMTPAPVTDENSPPKPLSLSCMFDEPTPPAQKNVRQSVMPALMRDEDAVPKKKKLKYAQQKIDLYYRPKKFKRQPLTPMELNMERSDDWNPYFNRSRAPKLIKDADSKTRKPTFVKPTFPKPQWKPKTLPAHHHRVTFDTPAKPVDTSRPLITTPTCFPDVNEKHNAQSRAPKTPVFRSNNMACQVMSPAIMMSQEIAASQCDDIITRTPSQPKSAQKDTYYRDMSQNSAYQPNIRVPDTPAQSKTCSRGRGLAQTPIRVTPSHACIPETPFFGASRTPSQFTMSQPCFSSESLSVDTRYRPSLFGNNFQNPASPNLAPYRPPFSAAKELGPSPVYRPVSKTPELSPFAHQSEILHSSLSLPATPQRPDKHADAMEMSPSPPPPRTRSTVFLQTPASVAAVAPVSGSVSAPDLMCLTPTRQAWPETPVECEDVDMLMTPIRSPPAALVFDDSPVFMMSKNRAGYNAPDKMRFTPAQQKQCGRNELDFLRPPSSRRAVSSPERLTQNICMSQQLPITIDSNYNPTPGSPPLLAYSLPVISNDQIARLQCETVCRLLNGEFRDKVDEFYIIDCRYFYEFQGGHLHGATNLCLKEELSEFFNAHRARIGQSQTRIAFVFHCEYSKHRAPEAAKFFRQLDRAANPYPQLCFPEVYVMNGGYREYFRWASEEVGEAALRHCEPRLYTSMWDEKFVSEHKRCKNIFRQSWNGRSKHFSRSRSLLHNTHVRNARAHSVTSVFSPVR